MQPVGWHIEVAFQEDDTRTEAAARLRLRDASNCARVAQPGATRMTQPSHTSARTLQLHGHCLIWCTSCSTRPRPRSRRQLISLHTCRCELTGYRRCMPTGSAGRFAARQRCRR
jgi:hypothetical protein